MLVAAKILLTIVIVGTGFLPLRADLNGTHATNPLWTGHARYHVVWQVLSYAFLGIVTLGLLWMPGASETARAHFAALIALSVLGGFFGAAASMRRYGGRLSDENGYPPLQIGSRDVDLNVLVFATLVPILAVAWVLAAAA